jgi:site-specific recombinase XerD
MTTVAPVLEAFFSDRLARQRQASPNTVAAYRDALRLLLRFVNDRTGKVPCKLDFTDLDAATIGEFLEHLELERGNSVVTRNSRLAALRSFFSYAAFSCPEHAGLIQRVLAIPQKRTDRATISFLTPDELDALLASPDHSTWIGRRDHALLVVAAQTGLRVSELTGLRIHDAHLDTGAHVSCHGKGRKDRCTPLTAKTVSVLAAWMAERRGEPDDPLFPSRSRGHGPLSRDSVEHLVHKHALAAQQRCPSLRSKIVSPHTLRHTCAMALLTSGVDVATIALWLGHEGLESTTPYIHADLATKERAIARTAPPATKPGRYRPTDALLAFLDGL